MLGSVLGIQDPWVWSAYLLCLVASALCIVYGAVNWNRGEEPVKPVDKEWARREKQVEEDVTS
jgi:hypothetical protein